MVESRAKRIIDDLLAPSDVRIDGSRPWDIRVHNPSFYPRVLFGGSLALGESYMDGWWDCRALDQFFERALASRIDRRGLAHLKRLLWESSISTVFNAQSRSRAFVIGERHYDIGNDLFSVMLDRRMNYSCGYWQRAETLEDAQADKLELICRKIALQPKMTVLDIGCGWGGFARYAAERYGAHVRGVTVSAEQATFAKSFCKGLDVVIELKDYRAVRGKFERIVSIGMFEHVGHKNFRTFMKVAHRCLRKGGLFLLHTIGSNTSRKSMDPWLDKYIFPNSLLPSARQISTASEGLFMIEDWHSFGTHYDRTLMAWHDNFTRHWSRLKERYGQRFYRMWTYFLLSCAGAFRSRRNQLWQILFSKNGIKDAARNVRQSLA